DRADLLLRSRNWEYQLVVLIELPFARHSENSVIEPRRFGPRRQSRRRRAVANRKLDQLLPGGVLAQVPAHDILDRTCKRRHNTNRRRQPPHVDVRDWFTLQSRLNRFSE